MKDSHAMVETPERRRQIQALLSGVKTKTEKDELAIIQYCIRLGVRIKYIPRNGNLPEITFEDFIRWLAVPLPGKGDVIVLKKDGLVCIVKSVGLRTITVAAALTRENVLSVKDNDIPLCRFFNAGPVQRKRLQNHLSGLSLNWSPVKYKLTGRVIPLDNQQVRISILGRKLGVGVFREINEKDQVVMYCLKMKDKAIRCSLYEQIGRACDLQFDMVSTQERALFGKDLAKSKLMWNGHAKRIEPLNYRVKKGKAYHYISDCFDILIAHDGQRPLDIRRLQAGNYFRYRQEAEDMVNHIYIQLAKMNHRRVEPSEAYYYVNTNYGVTGTYDKNKPKDRERFKRGNYFIGDTEANDLIRIIVAYRKNQFLKFNETYSNSQSIKRK